MVTMAFEVATSPVLLILGWTRVRTFWKFLKLMFKSGEGSEPNTGLNLAHSWLFKHWL